MMGTHCTSAIGHNDGLEEPMLLGESGNYLINALSYTQLRAEDGNKYLTIRHVRPFAHDL